MTLSHDTDTGDAVMFDDAKSPGNITAMLFGGVAFAALAFLTPRILTWLTGKEGEIVNSVLLFVGALLLAWGTKMWLLDSAGRGERGAIVIDADGIGGTAISDEMTVRLAWSRIREVTADASAVIVKFEPKDLSSSNPQDRKSIVRLSAARATPKEIFAAIERFRPQERES